MMAELDMHFYCEEIGMRQICLYNPLLNMQISYQATNAFGQLAHRIATLLSRENLCSSLYLAKFISPSLTLPLHALTQERTIAQITTDRDLIARAVQESRLGSIVSDNEVQLIAYPTIKMPAINEMLFKELETVLTQLQKQYAFSRNCDNSSINLTLYEEDPAFLHQLMTSLSQEVTYSEAPLYDEIRAGIAMARQNKSHHWKGQGGHQKKQYSLERPPQIFIRRAVDSEDEEPEVDRTRGKEGKEAREGKEDKRRKYREVTKEVPVPKSVMFNTEDFPLLT